MRGRWGKDSPLTGTILRYCIFIGTIFLTTDCHQTPPKELPSGELFGKIIYDTFIINRDSTDSWGEECLSRFNRKAFVDQIFDEVFDEKIIPYDYFTGEKLPLKQIRKMESEGEFSRKNISKIQFEERWIWDKKRVELIKQVVSMTIAYEVYDNTGKPRGQKPVFKLIFSK